MNFNISEINKSEEVRKEFQKALENLKIGHSLKYGTLSVFIRVPNGYIFKTSDTDGISTSFIPLK